MEDKCLITVLISWALDEVATSSASDKEIDIPELMKLLGKKTHHWKCIGMQVLDDLDHIKTIENDNNKDFDRFIEVIHCWKNRGHPPFTWSIVVNTLRECTNETKLADVISKRFNIN